MNEVENVNTFTELKPSENFNPDARIKFDNSAHEVHNIKDYGLEKCSDIAKNIFTPDIIKEKWKEFSPEQRQALLEKYGKEIAGALNIDFKGFGFTSICDMLFSWGISLGGGIVLLTPRLIETAGNLIQAIDTIAHELRHEFQEQALKNPQKYGLDEKTKKEWTVAKETYTTENPSEFDPFGYQYNPLELDARNFGESIVRSLQRDLINGVA